MAESKNKEEKKPESKGLSLIVDIQSGLVRVALIALVPNGLPSIVEMASHDLAGEVHTGGDFLIKTKTMLDDLEEITKEVMTKAMVKESAIDSIHYILSSPWMISQSKTVKIQYKVDTEITEATVQNLLNLERAMLLAKFKQENLKDTYDFDLTFIEQKIFDVRLNGYSLEKYIGKRARTFEVSFAVTLGSEKILNKIHAAVAAAVHVKKAVHHSSLLLQYIALRSIITRDEYVSIHVHGEITDVIIVRRNLNSSIAAFPYGANTLLRKMSATLKSSPEINDSILTMYEDGKLETAEKDKIEKTLKPLLWEWKGQFLEALNSQAVVIPHLMYLSVCSSSNRHHDIFKKSLEDAGYEVRGFDKHLMEVYITALQGML